MGVYDDFVSRLAEFLNEKYYGELLKASKEEKALVVDYSMLDRFDPIIADSLMEDPENVLKAFRKAAHDIIDEKINVRIKNLPENRGIRIRNLRSKHLGKMWIIDTIVKSASEVKPQIYEADFKCPDCGTVLTLEQDMYLLQKPYVCECGRRGDFDLLEKRMYDIRWISVIEPYELTSGEQPGGIAVYLKEDLTTPRMQRKTDPGNRIIIIGILKELPKRIKGRLSTRMDMYMEAVFVDHAEIEFEELEITPENEQKIRELASDPNIYERLKASIAPGIYGVEEIKEAIALQLFGGVAHYLPDGSRIRGNIHILLTGDPGVGKTVLLKLVADVMPRGKYVSGSGVTGAGLTASVRKDEMIGSWVLEAGALILANKSVIGIDEFDKMSRDDQIAMHEAMSVETISIAKASIVATLPAETAVLAGANPKFGRFDPATPIPEQLQIPETLLSRFDLKFVLRDRPDKTLDEKLADHIIMSRREPKMIEPAINVNLLRKYIAYAKQIKELELSNEAAQQLKNFYVDMRNRYGGSEVSVVSITLRQYEALLRLAEASAKIRLDTVVRPEDAERAINIMKYSLIQLGYDYETERFDIDRMESGITAAKRKKLTVIMEIINELQKLGKEMAIDDIRAEAESRGISDIDDIIDRFKREGTIFEPRAGYIRKL